MKKDLIAPILISVACFLALGIGGSVPTDTQGLAPGRSAIFTGLVGGPEVPLTTYAWIGALIAAAAVWTSTRKSVIQVPPYTQSLALAFFALSLTASVAFSAFRSVSLEALGPWLICIGSYFVAVASLGRRTGPLCVLIGVFCGGLWVAMRGLLEYADMKAIDPTWRIFAGWVNPNATAVALGMAWFAGIGLLCRSQRLQTLAVGAGMGAISLALLLTQSKGAYAAFAVGLVFAIGLLLIAGGSERRPWLTRIVAVVAIGGLLGFALVQSQTATSPTDSATAISRVQAAGETRVQSAGFRQLLWRGAGDLIRSNPIGYGVGTYRFESSRSGLTTQTVYAHNSYLQIAVEGGAIALLAIVVFAVTWLVFALRGLRRLDPRMAAFKASVLGAAAFVAAHSMVDSDLNYFGIALPFFVLLAIGTLSSPDGISPELLPPYIRRFAIAAGALSVLLCGYGAFAEATRAKTRGAVAAGDIEAARNLASQARAAMPSDGEAAYLSFRLAATPAEAAQHLETATRFAPSPRNWRALASVRSSENDFTGAISALDGALVRDPNNLPALLRRMEAEIAAGQTISAIETAKRLVAVEEKPYFQVRSLPEIIPTETYRARILWAQLSDDSDEKRRLLAEAMRGYLAFAATTAPIVERALTTDPNAQYAGIGREELDRNYLEGAEAAEALLLLDPEPTLAAEAREAAASLRASLSR